MAGADCCWKALADWRRVGEVGCEAGGGEVDWKRCERIETRRETVAACRPIDWGCCCCCCCWLLEFCEREAMGQTQARRQGRRALTLCDPLSSLFLISRTLWPSLSLLSISVCRWRSRILWSCSSISATILARSTAQ